MYNPFLPPLKRRIMKHFRVYNVGLGSTERGLRLKLVKELLVIEIPVIEGAVKEC